MEAFANRMGRTKQSQPERDDAAEQLRRQLDFTQALTNSLGEGLYALDREGRVTFMNPAAERLLGWTESELRGRNMHEATHFQRADGVPVSPHECGLQKVIVTNNAYRNDDEIYTRKDGTLISVACTASPIVTDGEVTGAVIAFRDITEIKRAEADLREQNEAVETVNRIGRMLAAELDTQKVVQAVTDAATELVGARFGSFFYNVLGEQGESYMLYTLSGVPLEAFSHFPMPRATDLFGPTFRGEDLIRIADVKQDPRYGKNSPYFGMPEGHLPVTSYLSVPVISRTDEVLGGLFFGHPDEGVFTARHERIVVGLAAQAAIAIDNARLYETAQRERARAEASQQNYRFMTEAIPQQVWTAQPDGTLDYFNQRVLDYFGRTMDEMVGAGWHGVIHENDLPQCLARWENSLATGETYEVEFRLRRADGVYRWHLGRALPLRADDGKIARWFGTNTDITDRKQTEAELLRRSRQSALGAEVGIALAGNDSLRNTLQHCAEAMVEQLDAAFARIWTLDEAGDTLNLQASAGMYTHLDGAHGSVPVGEFKIGRIAEQRRPHLTNAVIGDREVGDQEWAKREGMVAFAGYPLIVGNQLLGVMAMFARQPLADDILESLTTVAHTIAQGIERKRVEETLARLSREREQMLEEVSTPLVPVWDDVLVLPIIGSLDTVRMERATDAALHEVSRTGARACIIDITGARIIDSHAVARLSNLVSALQLIGAEAIVTGVSAHAAQSLVGLGLDLKGMRTHRTLAQALATIVKAGGARGATTYNKQ